MTKTLNTQINLEAKAAIFTGAIVEGTILLGDLGVEFHYKNPRMGKDLFYPWNQIRQAVASVSPLGKIGQQFSLVITAQNDVHFVAKNSGAILKEISEHIGKENVVRSKSLLDLFTRPFKN